MLRDPSANTLEARLYTLVSEGDRWAPCALVACAIPRSPPLDWRLAARVRLSGRTASVCGGCAPTYAAGSGVGAAPVSGGLPDSSEPTLVRLVTIGRVVTEAALPSVP